MLNITSEMINESTDTLVEAYFQILNLQSADANGPVFEETKIAVAD